MRQPASIANVVLVLAFAFAVVLVALLWLTH